MNLEKEVDLQKELVLVAYGTKVNKTAIATAFNILRSEANKHLKLRSAITGAGKIEDDVMRLNLTIPLDDLTAPYLWTLATCLVTLRTQTTLTKVGLTDSTISS